jgi:hypothetical protein
MSRRITKGLTGILAGLLLFGAIAACGGGQDSVSGLQATQYSLMTIDGHSLPHQISQSSDGTVTTAVTDMVLTIVEDQTWHSVGHQTVSTNGVPSVEVIRNSGSYTTSATPGPNGTALRDAAGNLVWVGDVTEREVSLSGADSLRWVFDR